MAVVSRTHNTSVSQETRSQEAAIRQWAKAQGVRIVRWFRESISGTTNPWERTAFQDMLTALHSNSVKLVICEKYDRVATDSMWIEWAIRHLRDSGFSPVSASEPELADDTDPHRKAMRGMISIFAESEKSALVLKLRAARQRARASRRGYREGRKPFGTRPGEQEAILWLPADSACSTPSAYQNHRHPGTGCRRSGDAAFLRPTGRPGKRSSCGLCLQ